jgi:hypothetical protein
MTSGQRMNAVSGPAGPVHAHTSDLPDHRLHDVGGPGTPPIGQIYRRS